MLVNYSKELLEEKVKDCYSLSELCRRLGLAPKGGNYATLRKKLLLFEVDYSHFTGRLWNKGLKDTERAAIRSLDEILQENTSYPSSLLRKRLIKAGLKTCKCERCQGEFNRLGEPLSLELHHINGNHYDNRLENLLILCIDCHSKTNNFRSRNVKKSLLPENIAKREHKNHYVICKHCGKEFYSDRTDKVRKFCSRECYNEYIRQNGNLNKRNENDNNGISKEVLTELCVKYNTITQIAQELNLHRGTIREYLKRYNLYYSFKNKKK